MSHPPIPAASRRAFLGLAAAGSAIAATGLRPAQAQAMRTSARIVILGAGAAGAALANQLTARLDGAAITLLDARKEHLYQPGLSLVAAGLKPARYTVSATRDWLPRGVTLIEEAAAAIDPEGKTVTATGGQVVPYDILIVATGVVQDFDAVPGFSRDMVGQNGIGALYGGPEDAARTWAAASKFAAEGGVGLFTRPATEMKCAGAPLKHAFLVEDIASRTVGRGKYDIHYAAPQGALFSVPIVAEKLRMLFRERGIASHLGHRLVALDPGARRATFETKKDDAVQTVEMPYDYIHVIPPQRAPDVVRQSGLSWADRWTDQGWVEVDPKTLRHARYPDVFAVGDVAGVPKGKTAASVKWQVPVVVDHLVAGLQGRAGTAVYDGYTSCPMITRVGRAMLIEFDYDNNLVPSFPGVIAPLEELWISWLMKELALKPTYNAMLRGEA
ncbi:MAG: NAD(P)/FAD-dependent oxidoreductase [Gemmobacter sp.]